MFVEITVCACGGKRKVVAKGRGDQALISNGGKMLPHVLDGCAMQSHKKIKFQQNPRNVSDSRVDYFCVRRIEARNEFPFGT